MVEALNKVLMYRDELLKEQAGIWKGEIKRIDALVEVNRERAMEMEERLVEIEAIADTDSGVPGDSHSVDSHSGDDAEGAAEAGREGNRTEADRLNAQLDELTEQRNALLLERTEWANKEFRIRILLELADEMMSRRQRAWEAGKDSTGAGNDRKDRMEWMSGAQGMEDPACRDYDDFFRRTRIKFPGNALNQEGDIVGFDKSLVIRYVDRVLVREDGFEVRLRAGISIKV